MYFWEIQYLHNVVSVIQVIKERACDWLIKATATTGNFSGALHKHWFTWHWTGSPNLSKEMIHHMKDMFWIEITFVFDLINSRIYIYLGGWNKKSDWLSLSSWAIDREWFMVSSILEFGIDSIKFLCKRTLRWEYMTLIVIGFFTA